MDGDGPEEIAGVPEILSLEEMIAVVVEYRGGVMIDAVRRVKPPQFYIDFSKELR